MPQQRRKALIGTFLEEIKPQFTDEYVTETENTSKLKVSLEFSDYHVSDARIKTNAFSFQLSTSDIGVLFRTSMTKSKLLLWGTKQLKKEMNQKY